MILKIELEYDKNFGSTWRLFGKLEEVEYNLLDYDPEVHTGFGWCILTDDFTDKNTPKNKAMAINCKREDNTGLSVLTQRAAFLLNDETGKTIERIS